MSNNSGLFVNKINKDRIYNNVISKKETNSKDMAKILVYGLMMITLGVASMIIFKKRNDEEDV